jgi:Restriction endonuclease
MGKNYTNAETVEKLASQFNLTDAERSETLSSGQAKFSKHIGWARTYLGKARLLESTGRGRFRITKRGLALLRTNPPAITNQVLEQYAEFRERNQQATSRATPVNRKNRKKRKTPEALLNSKSGVSPGAVATSHLLEGVLEFVAKLVSGH